MENGNMTQINNLHFRLAVFTILAAALTAQAGAFPFAPALGRSISLGTLTLTSVYPRIFTPNGDGFNDKVGFHFDNPEDLPVAGEIFDLSGAKVADLKPGTGDPASFLIWDGKDTDGRTVAGGIYIYQIEYQGKHATGTVAVAR
jgi:hypothetical protein